MGSFFNEIAQELPFKFLVLHERASIEGKNNFSGKINYKKRGTKSNPFFYVFRRV
jgi:hypothetical protein